MCYPGSRGKVVIKALLIQLGCILGNSIGSMLNVLNVIIVIWVRDVLYSNKDTVKHLGVNSVTYSQMVQKKITHIWR